MPAGKHNPPPRTKGQPHKIAHPKPTTSKPKPHKIAHPKPTTLKPRPHKIKHPKPKPVKPLPHKVKHPAAPVKPRTSAYVKFKTKNGSIDPVTVLFGEGPVIVNSGYGGWEITPRQRRVGLTVWNGREPFKMSIPVMFDGFIHRSSQELAISRLSRMGLPPSRGENQEPPVINISGAALPHPGPVDWVIESFDWGNNVIWDFSVKGVMSRLRQDCTVHLMQYIEEDRIAFKKIGNKTPPASTVAPKGWRASTIVKAGEKSLVQVAKRVYKPNRPGDYKLLGKANSINDPKHIRVGQRLRVPKR